MPGPAAWSKDSHPGDEHSWLLVLLVMLLLQPLVLHQLTHHVPAPPARTGPMGSRQGSGVSQSGPTVPGTALLPRVHVVQALGSRGRNSDERRLAAL